MEGNGLLDVQFADGRLESLHVLIMVPSGCADSFTYNGGKL